MCPMVMWYGNLTAYYQNADGFYPVSSLGFWENGDFLCFENTEAMIPRSDQGLLCLKKEIKLFIT